MRSEFAKKIKFHDWYYGYSDDHSIWTRGRKEAETLREMHTNLECPFTMKTLMCWAHNMVLEDFAEEEPGKWYRQPRKYQSIAPAEREDLITKIEHDDVTHWMSLGATADEIANMVK